MCEPHGSIDALYFSKSADGRNVPPYEQAVPPGVKELGSAAPRAACDSSCGATPQAAIPSSATRPTIRLRTPLVARLSSNECAVAHAGDSSRLGGRSARFVAYWN